MARVDDPGWSHILACKLTLRRVSSTRYEAIEMLADNDRVFFFVPKESLASIALKHAAIDLNQGNTVLWQGIATSRVIPGTLFASAAAATR
jgi:hypothetical protein